MMLRPVRAGATARSARRLVAATLVLAAVLLGSLAAGSPVAGEQNVATSTAGIHLGTPAPAPARAVLAAVEPLLSQELLRQLVLVLASLFVVVAVIPVCDGRSVARGMAAARRGPPAIS